MKIFSDNSIYSRKYYEPPNHMKPERYLKVYGGKKDDVFLQLLIQNTHKK
jgi:hypothetical protein